MMRRHAKDKSQEFKSKDHTHNLFNEMDMCEHSYNHVSEIACIHNLVGTSRVLTSLHALNLEMISHALPNAQYEKQKFAAITIRLASPFCTVLLFTSGKMVLTGCKTYLDCLYASLNILHMLRGILPGIDVTLETINVQNIVGNADLHIAADESLDLIRFYNEHNVWCTYQPCMFPGLIYRPATVPIVLLLFFSGKVVITGAKTMAAVHDGWAKLHGMVRSYIHKRALHAEAGSVGAGSASAGSARAIKVQRKT